MPQFDFFVFFALSFFTIIIIVLLYAYTTKDLAPYLFEAHKSRKHFFRFLNKLFWSLPKDAWKDFF